MVLEACKPKIKVPADLVRAALLVCRKLSSGCVLIRWRDRDRKGKHVRERTHTLLPASVRTLILSDWDTPL